MWIPVIEQLMGGASRARAITKILPQKSKFCKFRVFHEIFCATKIWSYRYINQLLKTRFKIRQTEIALKETSTLKLGLTLVMTVTQNCVFVNLCRDCHATSSIAYTLYCASAPFLHRESTASLTTDSENLKCSCAYLVCRKVIRPKPDLPDSLPWMLFRNVWPQVVLFNCNWDTSHQDPLLNQ